MKKKNEVYKIIWRWHFYAGLLIAPFLLILAITGSLYLFAPQIENSLYEKYEEIPVGVAKLSADEQLISVQSKFPEALITTYTPGEKAESTSEFNITEKNSNYTVFLNPYSGDVVKKLNDDQRLMEIIRQLHGKLLSGKTGGYLVELVACWTLVLVVTGAYLLLSKWKNKKGGGIFTIRFNKGKKILRRDLHAVPAIYLTIGITFLVATGLPWSVFWGTNFQNIVTNIGQGYPPGILSGESPASITKTKDLADVPWAAENLQIPKSIVNDYEQVSLDTIVENAEKRNMPAGYSISLPQTAEGIYVASAFPNKAEDEATMHMDQYSGAILTDYRFVDYGFIGKVIALGVTLHKGTQFGLINQLVGLVVCLGIIAVIFTGIYLWWKRKPNNKLGSPKATATHHSKGFLILLVIMGIIFPLVGVSLILIFLLEYLVIQRLSKVKVFFNA